MQSDEKFKNKVVHTFSDDMAESLGENQDGSLRELIKEQEEKEEYLASVSIQSPENKVFVAISTVLIVLSLIGLVYIFFIQNSKPVGVTEQFRPIIFVDHTQFVPIDNLKEDQIVNTLKSSFALSTVKLGGVDGYYLTKGKKILDLKDFAKITAPSLPQPMLELSNPNFLVGIVKGTKNEPLILIKVKSFEDAFTEMQKWEDKMFFDLHDLFEIPLGKENNVLLNKDFEDGFVNNKNARILYHPNGTIALMYIYADDTSIIITRSSLAAREVMRRLSSSEISK